MVAVGECLRRVVARVRPLTQGEHDVGHVVGLTCLDDARTVHIDTPPGEDGKRVTQSYSLDVSVPPEASQVCVCCVGVSRHCTVDRRCVCALSRCGNRAGVSGSTGGVL